MAIHPFYLGQRNQYQRNQYCTGGDASRDTTPKPWRCEGWLWQSLDSKRLESDDGKIGWPGQLFGELHWCEATERSADEFQEAHVKVGIQPSTIQQSSCIAIAEVEEFRILFQLGLKRATSHMWKKHRKFLLSEIRSIASVRKKS